jgi:hypothetical protein
MSRNWSDSGLSDQVADRTAEELPVLAHGGAHCGPAFHGLESGLPIDRVVILAA